MGVFLNLPVTTTADIALAVRTELAAELARMDVAVSSRESSTDPRLDNLDATISSREASADPRLANLDATISSRESETDPRLANLDAAVSSRATPADVTVTVTVPPSGEVT